MVAFTMADRNRAQPAGIICSPLLEINPHEAPFTYIISPNKDITHQADYHGTEKRVHMQYYNYTDIYIHITQHCYDQTDNRMPLHKCLVNSHVK